MVWPLSVLLGVALFSATAQALPPPVDPLEIVPERVVIQEGSQIPAWKQLWDEARDFTKAGEYERAVQKYLQLLDQQQELDPARWELARLLLLQRDAPGAVAHLERLVSRHPEQTEYLAALSEALVAAENFSRAVDVIRRLLAREPGRLDATGWLVDCLFALGRKDEAVPYLEELHRRYPENNGITEKLAFLYAELGLPAKARPLLRRLIELKPRDPQVLAQAARALEASGRLSEAVAFWKRLLEIDPDNKEAERAVFRFLVREGSGKQALEALQEAVSERPGDPFLLKRLGEVSMGLGHFAEALEYFGKYIKVRPDDREVLGMVLDIHQALGNSTASVAVLERLLELHTGMKPEQLKRAAELLETQGRFEQALTAYQRLGESRFDDPRVVAREARLLFILGKTGQAEEVLGRAEQHQSLLRALELLHDAEPGNTAVALKLAAILLERGETERCLRLLEQLEGQGQAERPEVLLLRSAVEERLGHVRAALAALDFLLEKKDEPQLRLKALLLAGGLGLWDEVRLHGGKLKQESLGFGETLRLANAYRDSGLFDLAASRYSTLLQEPLKSEEKAAVLLARARFNRLRHRLYEAEEDLRRALELGVRRGEILAELVDLALDEGDVAAGAAWISLWRRLGAGRRGHPDHLLFQLYRARLSMLEGKNREAAALVRSIPVSAFQGDGRGLILSGAVLIRAGRWQQAMTLAGRALARLPGKRLEATAIMAASAISHGDPSSAQRLLDQELAGEQGDVSRKIRLAKHTLDVGVPALAVQLSREALEEEPASFEAWRILAESHVSSGDLRGAAEAVGRLRSLLPANRTLALWHASLLLDIGELADALAVLDAVALQEVADRDPRETLLRAHLLWLSGKREESIRFLGERLGEFKVEERFERMLAASGLTLPGDKPKGPGLFRKRRRPALEILARLLAPGVTSLQKEDERGLLGHALPLLAEFRWQDRLTRVVSGRRALMRREYHHARKELEQLARRYPGDKAVYYDLAGVYSALDRLEAEARIYDYELAGAGLPGLAEARRRNVLKRRPRTAFLAGFESEEGRDGYKDIERRWAGVRQWLAWKPGHEFAAIFRRQDYRSHDHAVDVGVNRTDVEYHRDLGFGLTADLAGGVADVEGATGGVVLLNATLSGEPNDLVGTTFTFQRDLVDDTVASIERKIVSETVKAALRLDVLPRLAVGGDYAHTEFSDNNWTERYAGWVRYHLLPDPYRLTLGYTYDFRDSNEGPQDGVRLEDGFAAEDHPYWAPRSYWQKRFEVSFHHGLGPDSLGRSAPRSYGLKYLFAYDSLGHAFQSWEGGVEYEFAPHFLVRINGQLTSSQDYRSKGAILQFDYRW